MNLRNPVKELSSFMQFKSNCRVVFSSPQGKQILSYLMKSGCVTTPVAHADKDEALRNEGMQRLVLSLLRATYRTESEVDEQIQEEMS